MSIYSTGRFELTIITDCIFRMKPAEGIDMDIRDVLEMRKKYLEFSGNKPFAVLLDATGSFTVQEDARALLASKQFTEKRKAAALVTPGLANRIVGNFFIRFNKPATPTKLFNDEVSALLWLKEQMKDQ
jgi:hypothetical protein